MKEALLGFFIFLLIVLVMVWVFQGNDFFLYKFFAPRQAAVQREVFENTPSYVRGNVQELSSRIEEYKKCKAEGKKNEAAMLRSNILHYAAGLNQNDFPQYLKDDLAKINSEI